jgi:plastocyanin
VSEKQPLPVVQIAVVSVAVIAVIALGAILALTGGGDDDDAIAAPTIVNDLDFTIEIPDFEFDPPNVSVPAGANITFQNTHAARHNAMARDESWKTEDLDRGESDTLTFDAPGSWEYICSIHPYMEGVLTVR